ncbi:MAG: class II aldolase/adducin family protein, partial [Verrucomicrobiae bacterium]|nr:class II aldolase/adducin family protein [Verrucomicrobiae bacterium]
MRAAHKFARQLCEVGRFLWQRGYANGTDSNLSIRLDTNRVLCTPTMMSKGAMRPADMCIVDMDGRQQAGRRRCTSEIRVHLAVYRNQPLAQAVVHCHSPHGCA